MRNVRIGVAGCGYWGKNLVRVFHELGSLGAVCDPTLSGRQKAQKITGDTVPVLEDFEEMLLGKHQLDGIVLATPAPTHGELGRKVLSAGKDLFVEKPLALNVQEGRALLQQAKEHGRILMVGHILEYHPAFVELRRLVRQKEFGKLRFLYSHRMALGKIRCHEDVLWSFAPHDVSLILGLVGSGPTEVLASSGSYLQPGIADRTLVELGFIKGVRAHILVSWLHPFKEQRFMVVGSSQSAMVDGIDGSLTVWDTSLVLDDGQWTTAISPPHKVELLKAEPLHEECQAFIDAIATRTSPLSDGVNGLAVLEVLERASSAMRSKNAATPVW